jgi:hypothetical protein
MIDEDTSTGTELTTSARRSIAYAREAASRRGHEYIDSADLVLGLMAETGGIAATALAELGVREAGVIAAIAASPLINPPMDGRFLGDDLADTLTAAARHSLRDDCGITTGHLLLGVISSDNGTGAFALAALGVTAGMINDAVPRVTAARPEGASLSAAVARADVAPDHELPGRSTVVVGIAASTVVFAGLAGVVSLSTPTLADAALVGTGIGAAAAGQFLLTGAVLAVAPSVAARPYQRQRTLVAPPYLVDLMRRRGVRRFEMLAQTGGIRRNRSLRVGRRAWLVLAPATIRTPRALAFVLGHELAHLARQDSLRRRVDLMFGLALLYGGALSANPVGWVTAVVGAALLWVVPRWGAEFAADLVGVRWSGPDAMRAWASAVPPVRRRTRLRALLTHPPLRRRLRRATTAPG